MMRCWSRAGLARGWNQRARAWWLCVQPGQWSAWPGGGGGGEGWGGGGGEGGGGGVWGGGRAGMRRQGRLCGGLVFQQGGGDGADGQGGHDQDGVPQDRVVEADLGLVEAEAVLAELEILFDRPSEPGGADQPGHAGGLARGEGAVEYSQHAGLQEAADAQPG